MTKPECILLVGMQGCGKTTYARDLISNSKDKEYTLISQDYSKNDAYKDELFESLNEHKNIIIDRINHTHNSRNYFLKLAKKKGYTTKIINLNLPLKKCVKRLLIRDNHPTFNPKNYKEATQVLYRFLKEYEKPQEDEADSIENPTCFDPYCLDLSDKYSKFIIIGDVHGCFDEFKALYEKEEVQQFIDNNTAIVFIGDLIDKGPKIKEILDFYFSTPNSFCIRGNHEYKLQRYLRGNNIEISHGFDKTLEQCNLDKNSSKFNEAYAQFLLEEMDSLPFSIKIGKDNFIVHAGLHPKLNFFTQPKEYFLFARTYNPMTHSFNTPGDLPWFEYYNKNNSTIFFGHNFHSSIEISKNVFSLDGYCVYGKELRCALITTNSNTQVTDLKFVTQQAFKQYKEESKMSYKGLISQFEYLKDKGYLQKSVDGDLILYNYTQKAVYDKKWSPNIMQGRGIIFDSNNNLIARPFGKFFNINETEFTQLHNLPKDEKFEVFEKIDGVLGIVFFYNNSWRLSTRGDLKSFQSDIGQKLLEKLNIQCLDTQYTYLFEIVHPKSKIIIDYREDEKLYLLAGIHTQSGQELDYNELKLLSKHLNTSIVTKIESFTSLDEIVNTKDKLSLKQEGYVIKFESGLRVKLKGDEYLELVRLHQGINFNSLIRFLDLKGNIIHSKLQNIPEELQEEVMSQLQMLSNSYKKILKELEEDKKKFSKKISRKELSKYFKEKEFELNHPTIFFKNIDNKIEDIQKYVIGILKNN